ncbi:MAG TPA: DUF3221 domain-containing protein [Bacilli bacterium]|nr:DUF3221 domain-containing protein [Bacilli bacterium]
MKKENKIIIVLLVIIIVLLAINISFNLIHDMPKHNCRCNCLKAQTEEEVIDDPIQEEVYTGIITDINSQDKYGTILVEAEPETDSGFKASVRVDKNTIISQAELSRAFTFADLKLNQDVEITFSGPVAESYPVQGIAAVIHIIE